MAIDTKDKRFNMLDFGLGDALLPDRDGSIDANDRAHLLDLYGGNSLVAAIASLNLRIELGSVVLLASGDVAIPSGASGVPWKLEALFTVRSIGASGSVMAHGEYDNGQVAAMLANAVAVTVDTTIANDVQASAQWGVADAANIVLIQELAVWESDPN